MKNGQPLVSVVTITYNHEKYLKQALDSIISQSINNFNLEIIVSDDASTDGTASIIQDYSIKYPEIVKPIINKENIGIQNNLINALKKTRGKYVAVCEGDDYWTDQNKLQMQFDVMESNERVSICFHPTRVFFENKSYPDTKFPSRKKGFSSTNLMEENFIPTNSVMYRRVNYDFLRSDLMPFDWYLHGYCLNGGEIYFINKTMSAYRRHENGAWWNSHKNAKLFWYQYGPKMAEVLAEFRNIHGKDKAMIKGIRTGEFRVIRKSIDSGCDFASIFNDEVQKNDFILKASDYMTSIDKKIINKDRKIETLKYNLQEAELSLSVADENLKLYMNELKNLQDLYDKFRKDLRNPVTMFKKLTGRIIHK